MNNCYLIWNCKPDAATWHAFFSWDFLLRLELTGDHGGELPGGIGCLINGYEMIACEVSWMRYGPTGSRYRHRQDLVSEVVINVFVEMLYVVVGVRWCGL